MPSTRFIHFSKRFEKAFKAGNLKVEIGSNASQKVRYRLGHVFNDRDEQIVYQPRIELGDPWTEQTDVSSECLIRLKKAYGTDKIYVNKPGRAVHHPGIVTTIAEIVEFGPWSTIFDLAEIFYDQSRADVQPIFQREVNECFDSEDISWRMIDGKMFLIDATFVSEEVVNKTQEFLSQHGFEGASEEFSIAREKFQAKDSREVIWQSHASFESVMKTILGQSGGNASTLIRSLKSENFFEDLPIDFRDSFCEQVLMTLPTIGNKLGRHGQGAAAFEVPHRYAELSLHLAATFNLFLVKKHIDKTSSFGSGAATSNEPKTTQDENDLPF